MLGALLRPLRSGAAKMAANDRRTRAPVSLEIASPEFASGTTMPGAYRGKDGISPPLTWDNVPEGTAELVLIVEDVDVPLPQPLVHALVYALQPSRTGFGAGEIPKLQLGGGERIPGAALGKSSGLGPGWLPVTPIPGHGPHRYVFQLFALDVALPQFARAPSRETLLRAMAGHVLARGATVGLAEA